MELIEPVLYTTVRPLRELAWSLTEDLCATACYDSCAYVTKPILCRGHDVRGQASWQA